MLNFESLDKNKQIKFFYKTLIVLVVLASLLNADRLLLGKNSALRKHDVTDTVVPKFQECGAYWHNPSDHLWDSSIQRGWPAYLGTVQPQHLGCFLSSFLPVYRSYAVSQILIESLLLIGAFLFIFNFLGYRYPTALFGCLSYLCMYYWWNENPYVTQVAFFPLVVAAVAVGVRPIPGFLRFILLLLAVLLSYPPYFVPLLPVCHFVCLLSLSDKEKMAANIKRFIIFWGIFALLYFPNIAGYVLNWSHSNRSLWEPRSQGGGLISVMKSLSKMGFLFPFFPLIVALNPLKHKRSVVCLVLAVLFMLIDSQVGLLGRVPIVRMFSFFYARIFYYISFVLMVAAVFLMEKSPIKFSIKNIIAVTIFTCAGAWLLYSAKSLKIALAFTLLSVLSIVYVKFNCLAYAKTAKTLLVLALLFVIPFKMVGMKHYEQVPYGFLYQDPFEYKSSLEPYRAISLTNECVPHTVHAGQVSIKGVETLDGNSVFYSKISAENWLKYPLANLDECSFKSWNNRMALTDGLWFSNPNGVFNWLRLNNVTLLKSQYELDHPGLVLEDTQKVPYSPIRSYITPKTSVYRTYYLYSLKNPISRVFAIDNAATLGADGRLRDGGQLFKMIDTLPVENIGLRSYRPSALAWSGDFGNKRLFVSTNYHKNWKLFVDHVFKKDSVQKGPFGMLMLLPDQGVHEYELRYSDYSYPGMILCLVLGAGSLFIFTRTFSNEAPV